MSFNASERTKLSAKHLDPKKLVFSVFTSKDIKNLSVEKICTPLSFNVLGHPLKGGLYDPALGPLSEQSLPCGTCGGNVFTCTGHFGHIELPVVVVNPLFHTLLCTLTKLACLKCYTLQIKSHIKLLLTAKLRLLQNGFYSEVAGLDQEISPLVNSDAPLNEGEIEFIREKINEYLDNVNANQSEITDEVSKNRDPLNTKNINMQWHYYVENVLKLCKPQKVCFYCISAIPKITILKNKIMQIVPVDDSMDRNVIRKHETVLILPDQSKANLQRLWENESEILKVIAPCLSGVDLEYPTDVFFFDVIPVLPPIVRPTNFMNGQVIEHPQSQVYKSIIQDCLVLRNIIQTIQDGNTSSLPEEGRQVFDKIRGKSAVEKLHNAWQNLQANVDHVMDREMSKTSESLNCQGLKQVIEKKEGVIRMHMMGKRVNFAARSVITPDPNLNIDEIGVPEAFALKLTYPVPVTPWNVTELRQMIINGPEKHPGALMIEDEDGIIKKISPHDVVQREAIAKRLLTSNGKANNFFYGVKVIHRHLQNGDIMLLNRQPTLHKPSIMAHKARILKGEKTLRLHYANCKAYNADFDGDEMNAHFPQNELARSEGYFIANVSNQYLVPKDGTPLGGLIQDHVISGVKLTMRGKFFGKQDYMRLVYAGLSDHIGDIILLPPTILKPIKLWSGKQIVSTVIINTIPKGRALINLTAGAKIGAKEWVMSKPRPWKCGEEFSNPKTMSEAEVIIRNGELLSGIFDKTHYGATPYGLVHCVFELYGGASSCKLLSSFGKLFQAYLQLVGFTLGISDILIVPKNDTIRQEIISRCRQIGDSVQKAVLELPDDVEREVVIEKMEESHFKNQKFRAIVDRKYKTALDPFTNDINKTCLPAGLLKKFPDNNLQLMVQSGAKGSTVNTMQISCLLGQIELEGKRPPLMISGRSLPSFSAFDPTPRAGGFIDGRFMTGIQPQEFFFHCMAGREGLIDTAVKTSRSGYLQRCLIKHLEGLTVNYDLTVRDSDGSLVQFYYGEDGLDIPNSRFLRKEQIDFLLENKNAIIDKNLLKILKSDGELEKILKATKKIRKWKNKYGDAMRKERSSAFTRFSKLNSKKNSSKNKKFDTATGRSLAAKSLQFKWSQADEVTRKQFENQDTTCPDPVFSKYRQDLKFGVLTEHMESLIDDYMKLRQNKFTTAINKDELRDMLCFKIMRTICPPGEPVGLLAAQSVGEPSTQMTLNTFHFAGRGDMNVTLGIPRLREILMMASKNIKTPSMEIPFKTNIAHANRQINRLRLKLTKCVLSDVLKCVKIDRKMSEDPQRQLEYTLSIEFLPHKYYKQEFLVHSKEVVEKTETLFFNELFREIKKIAKVSGAVLHVGEERRRNINEENSMLDDGFDDPDVAVSKVKIKPDIGEMHESSDEEEAADDADATTARSMARHQENKEYDDPEEDEVMDEPSNDIDEENVEISEEKFVDLAVDDVVTPEMLHLAKLKYDQRKRDVANMYPYGIDYDYDNDKFHWCKFRFWLPLALVRLDMPTIIRTVASRVVLWQTPEIRRAFTFQNQSGETLLKTDGINIVEMFKYHEILDLERLYSNDIYGISQTYGIEAANRVILKEVRDVFKMYGITVDSRHLSLIADYMTFDGTFQPLSRKGMEDSASPLQQMTFESSLTFLKNATLQGRSDDLLSPSSRLMLGQPCKAGTGAFGCFLKTQDTFINKSNSLKV